MLTLAYLGSYLVGEMARHNKELTVDNFAFDKAPTEVSDQLASVIFGRFMLPDTSEHACQVSNVTYEGADFVSEVRPIIASSIVAYLEEIGRIEAAVLEHLPRGFRIGFTATGGRLDRLKARIDFLQQKMEGAPDNRRHARYEPREKTSQITLPDGRVYNCEVVDISISGAAIKLDVLPSIGTYMMVGKMRARVVRYLDNGVGVEFVKQLDHGILKTVT